MRQPIIVTTPEGVQKYVGKAILSRIVLITILTLFIIALDIILLVLNGISAGLFTNAGLLTFDEAQLVFFGLVYIYVFVMYFRARHHSLPAIVIDEQGIHANKLFIPWDNIAAIFPWRVKKVEYVGVLPRNLSLVLRRSNLNVFLRIAVTIMATINRLQGKPPFGLVSDSMTMQELLQQIWNNYYPEYQRYQISPYPPR
ncbi:MAG: hypothetical protein M3Y81_27655 [Chloroflexota bacterium]|nr:hypothetical protein [Chloroflexota bacterium]